MQMSDLPTLRHDRKGKTERLQQLRRPGPRGDDHAVRFDDLGTELDPGHPTVAGQQPGRAVEEARPSLFRCSPQGGSEQASIDTGRAADMHRGEVRAQWREELACLRWREPRDRPGLWGQGRTSPYRLLNA